MKTKPRWMKSVIATAKQALPPLPFAKAVKINSASSAAPEAAQA